MAANSADPENPYASPSAEPSPGPSAAPCPKCGSHRSKKLSFTWWGGAIGPRLLRHVKCLDCGAGFNSQTGRSNTRAIILYQVVGLALGVARFWWLMSMH